MLTQREEVKGPPAYLTTDWKAAEDSVKKLKDLNPELVLPSHGLPMEGEELAKHLDMLARHFEEVAVPEQGRFL
jgi:glyoxylase-like metal-dependent hydrolase (beta-lactamase superfamily II)